MNKIYQAYYTKNSYITEYMVGKLDLNENDMILEPCGGEGDFIDAILEVNPESFIDTVDIQMDSVNFMSEKYSSFPNINIREADTLMDQTFDDYAAQDGYYDKIIGNPPYGGWQDYEKRTLLKKKYNNFYVKETYSLFLMRSLSLLKEGGSLTFIIPDTFLYLHNHKELREHLIFNNTIQEILIFPSRLFPGVSFGYSNLCIITVKKEKPVNNIITIYKELNNEYDFKLILNEEKLDKFNRIQLSQDSLKNNESFTFYLNKSIEQIMNSTTLSLSDIADCVTGIYTGDNKSFFYARDSSVKRSKNYNIVEKNLIDYNCTNLTGVSDKYKFVPIIKGNSETPYIRDKDEWFIDWSEDAIKFYQNNKKSRFQNSQYYFREGIAVPMVKSSKLKATIMQYKVFDQSIVGVFPKDKTYLLYILGLLNSTIARDLLMNINPTANNSANYLKRIPIVMPKTEELEKINHLVQKLLKEPLNNEFQKQLDEMFYSIYIN